MGAMKKPGVLIVDDSVFMRHVIMKMFETEGYFEVVGTAVNGKEAIEKIAECNPDLITLDVEMPEMDGMTALKYIKKHYSIPVVMLSTYTEEGAQTTLEAMNCGAEDFFNKEHLLDPGLSESYTFDFLLRCKAAVAHQMLGELQEDAAQNPVTRLLMDMLAVMTSGGHSLEEFPVEWSDAVWKHGGLLQRIKQVSHRYFCTFSTGDMSLINQRLRQSLAGLAVNDLFPEEVTEQFARACEEAWGKKRLIVVDYRLHDQSLRTWVQPLLGSNEKEWLTISMDLSDQHKMKKQLDSLVSRDSLTGLPNLQQFAAALEEYIGNRRSQEAGLSVLSIELSNFRILNETLGHLAGEQILQMVSKRLKAFRTRGNGLARNGEDNFLLLFDNNSYKEVEEYAEQVLISVCEPFWLSGNEIHLNASIGTSRYPQDGTMAENLIHHAEIAKSTSREQRNSLQFFNPTFNEQLVRKNEIEQQLRKALQRKEFSLCYQFLMDAQTTHINGVECLIRWNNELLGEVSPAEFIPIAEEVGLIREIGEWVMEEACHQNKAWQIAGVAFVPVCVNISPQQFFGAGLESTIERILNESGLDPAFLELEITESMTMHLTEALTKLHSLKRMGVKIAIDDFGTGYSSLSYLKHFPIDKLKIDRSFISGIMQNEADRAIVQTIINLAHNLKLQVVAEGVETEDDRQLLKHYGCDTLQGYLFGIPRVAKDLDWNHIWD